jgi:hypothetical protein
MSYEDYTLNQSQKDHLQNLINSEQYDLGYRYISEQIDSAVQTGTMHPGDPPPINESRNSYGNAIHNGLIKGGAGYGT